MDKHRQFAYDAEPVRCHACAAMERQARSWANREGADTAGISYRVSDNGDLLVG